MDLNGRILTEQLQKKWKPIVEHADVPRIADPYRKAVTTVLLENEERFLAEAAPANNAAAPGIDNWDPILISLVRRAMPNLIAFDIAGVQPMTGPTGLIFAMKSRYTSQSGTEALGVNEANTPFSGDSVGAASASPDSYPGLTAPPNQTPLDFTDPFAVGFDRGRGMTLAAGEAKGDSSINPFAEMAFSIEKATVTAKTRALKAEYTTELQQDLKAVHGLDAETELANILSSEILAEINREVVRTIYFTAKRGAQKDVVTAGTFDLNTDSNGRWSVEKFKGLLFQIERDANQIAKETRRGKGNWVLCSSDVASALSMAGMLDYAPAMSTNLNVDDTGNTFAGVLNGRTRVYIDPYFFSSAHEFFCVGYKGSSPYDAGLFYAPYVPLQMVRAVGENSFQPKIGFKTRYGLVSNPFVDNGGGFTPGEILFNKNQYYRIVKVLNLL